MELIKVLLKFIFSVFSKNRHEHYLLLKTTEDGKKLFIKNKGETTKNILIRSLSRKGRSIFFNWDAKKKEPFSLERG
ncbi:MAG: hypothetical protein Q7S00_08205, partial [bacterium]|nr:hypothetical protein [bacterium]